MMNTPIRCDTDLFETLVSKKQVSEVGVGLGYVIYTGIVPLLVRNVVRGEHRQIREGEAMMFIIVSKKSEDRVLVDHSRFKNSLIPANHFIKAPCAVDDVCKLRWSGHMLIPFAFNREPWNRS